jgi:hypothetical protein
VLVLDIASFVVLVFDSGAQQFEYAQNYKHRFWGETRFFSLFRPFVSPAKAFVREDYRLLGQALNKRGIL